MDGGFLLFAFVAGFLDPVGENFAVTFELVGEGGVGGEVVDLEGVFGEVVEFLLGAEAEPELGLVVGEFSLFVEAVEVFDGGLFVAVLGLEHGAIRMVIADVAELVGADGADAVDGVVAAVPGGDDEFAGFVVFRKEVDAVEVVRDFHPGQGEGGGGDVEAEDEVLADGASFEGGVIALDHEGDVDTAFVAKLFVAEGLVVAVVGEEKDDGVFELAVGFEEGEDFLDLGIGATGGVVVLGPRGAVDGGVGEVGRDGDVVVGEEFAFADVPGFGFASPDHDLAEPRLVFVGALAPGVLDECFLILSDGVVALPAVHSGFVGVLGADGVEFAAVVEEVVVVLAGVEGEVAGLAEEFGEGADAVGEIDVGVGIDGAFGGAGGAVLVGASGGLVDAGDHGGAGCGANGGGHEGAFEEDALGGEFVDGGGVALVDRVVVAAHVGGEVFREDPEDVGAAFRGRCEREEGRYQKEEDGASGHGLGEVGGLEGRREAKMLGFLGGGFADCCDFERGGGTANGRELTRMERGTGRELAPTWVGGGFRWRPRLSPYWGVGL